MHVHSSTIYDSQQVKIAQMSINGWINKQMMISTDNGILSTHPPTPKKRMKYRYMLQIQHGSTSKTSC